MRAKVSTFGFACVSHGTGDFGSILGGLALRLVEVNADTVRDGHNSWRGPHSLDVLDHPGR